MVITFLSWGRIRMVDKESMREPWEERDLDIDKDCQCNDCIEKDTCEFAYDLYNTSNDSSCLALK